MAHERWQAAPHAGPPAGASPRSAQGDGDVMQALISDATYPIRGAGATHRPVRPFSIGACAQFLVVHLDITA
jgi:hypothetical protein